MNIDLRCHPAFFSVTPRDVTDVRPPRPPRWRRTRGVPAAPRRRYRPAGPRDRCCSARASGPWQWANHGKSSETGKLYIYVYYIYIIDIDYNIINVISIK